MDIDCAYFLLKQVLQAHLDVTDNNIPDSSSNEESLHEKIRRSIEEGVKKAAELIDSGAALKKLEEYIIASNA